jgi:hypothetical protein
MCSGTQSIVQSAEYADEYLKNCTFYFTQCGIQVIPFEFGGNGMDFMWMPSGHIDLIMHTIANPLPH